MECVLLEELGMVGVQRVKGKQAGGGTVGIRFGILIRAARVDRLSAGTVRIRFAYFKKMLYRQ